MVKGSPQRMIDNTVSNSNEEIGHQMRFASDSSNSNQTSQRARVVSRALIDGALLEVGYDG